MKKLFKSSRVQLVPLEIKEAIHFARWSEDGEYLRNLDTEYAIPRNEEFFKTQIQTHAEAQDMIEMGIRVSNEGSLIGFISLHSIEWNNRSASLAVGIGESDYRERGLGSEAIQLILNYAFNELNLNRVNLDVIGNNDSAISCYTRNGFVIEGSAREAVLRDGDKYDKIYMGILKREWEKLV